MKSAVKFAFPAIDLRRGHGSLSDKLSSHIRDLIAGGVLAPGSRLPASRSLARQLGISRNTVLAAYQALTDGGLVCGRIGSGTRVAVNNDEALRVLCTNPRRHWQRLRESGFPLRRIPVHDPDGHTLFLHD